MVLPGGKNFLYRLSRQYEKQFAERSNETLPLRLYVPPYYYMHGSKERKKKSLTTKRKISPFFPKPNLELAIESSPRLGLMHCLASLLVNRS